jgi:hypothetical protein
MTGKRKEALYEYAITDGATEISIVKESGKQPRVHFTCHCGEAYSKQVNDVTGVKKTGLFCYKHSMERKRRKEMIEIIRAAEIKDNAVFNDEETVWKRPGWIAFTCFCGEKHKKDPSAIKHGQGMFCKVHTKENTKKKIHETSLSKYGVDHYTQSSIVRENYKINNFNKYGVEHIAHVPKIHTNQQKYSWKRYQMPSGDVRLIQGYENLALDELVKIYPEETISTSRKGIKYMFNEEEHYYYPDIILDTDPKTIIEVKSTYTMYYKHHYERNLAKRNGCILSGYKFEFWIYDKKLVKSLA